MVVPRRGESVVANGLFGLGVPELLVIGGVVAVVFGPQQLPQFGKMLGKTAKGFQEAAGEFKDELKKGMEEEEADENTSGGAGELSKRTSRPTENGKKGKRERESDSDGARMVACCSYFLMIPVWR